MSESQSAFEIVIAGGGTAGWLSAALLSRQLPLTLNRPVKITLIEASDIPTVGVGEATIPTIRNTLASCGLDEFEFMRACKATFKHGIEFIQWRQSPEENLGESYFHPFGDLLKVGTHSPVRQWSRRDTSTRGNIADLFSVQSEAAFSGRAPKKQSDRPYDGALAYAYHLDAGLLVEYLKEKFRGHGIRQYIAKIVSVERSENGDNIDSLTLDDGRNVTADLFIDCTGFASRLINSDESVKFKSKSDILFVDRAVTTRIPIQSEEDIRFHTKCTAQNSGWIWDIALQERRGTGYVFSSRHTSDDGAIKTLAGYTGVSETDLEYRLLDMRIGYQTQQWRGNCVAVGLSSGFLEPLESTGIYLVEMANWTLLDLLPRFASGHKIQPHYNSVLSHHYENIVDFLKLHYCISQRTDSAFWIDNKKTDTIPETLLANLEVWKDNIPSIYDFDKLTQCFALHNYLFVLFGMGWKGHTCPTPSDAQSDYLLNELAIRRDRLKQFVWRDTAERSGILQKIR